MAKKDGGGEKAAEQSVKRVHKERQCRCCGKTGHNAQTCTAEIVDLDNSNTSE
ncbi:hypothetical protein BU25DRAFT_414820 [Macroventuria anomochaeta]|uniref:Uncharacterized protein n=1 Tax=Macroventuria anomochaeta TaxID=301207 RepID=A0ACB6RNE3_9PLEO|nr:uncharacterized protein BU25DRAFT_414820 [Macroventuria anomochaeta]KAF2622827.1 hypothetical protein BU25DRAFT_414820 [Macroventuria anomochaeta]